MESRRSFLAKGAAAAAVLSIGPLACCHFKTQEAAGPLATKEPRKAIVLWFSQTGFTERYGKLIARRLEMAGLTVDAGEIRRMEPSSLPSYDLIVFGSPVFHYDIPPNVKQWLDETPSIDGRAVAAFVSFGGPEGNQYNAACSVLEPLTKRGGVPVGLSSFMNLATFPYPDWKGPGIQENLHLPDEGTYNQVRAFSAGILDRIRQDFPITFSRKFTLRENLSVLPLAGILKLYTEHTINQEKCIGCGTCVRKCPVKAISLVKGTIDREHCLGCFGCFNNCPTGAMEMTMSGKPLYSFIKFRAQNKLTVVEPAELQDTKAAF
jgi:ferredoxin/flavodoxin